LLINKNFWNRNGKREKTWIKECNGMKRELWEGKREYIGKKAMVGRENATGRRYDERES